jgi:hypothetical protein
MFYNIYIYNLFAIWEVPEVSRGHGNLCDLLQDDKGYIGLKK